MIGWMDGWMDGAGVLLSRDYKSVFDWNGMEGRKEERKGERKGVLICCFYIALLSSEKRITSVVKGSR